MTQTKRETPGHELRREWDDEPPFGAVLSRTTAMLQRAFAEEVGITGPGYRLLRLVARHDGMSQSQIERLTSADGATVTRVAKALEADGYLRRAPDAADNRFTRVFITEAGRTALLEMESRIAAMHARVFAGISAEDVAICRRVLEQVQNGLTKDLL